MYYNIPLNGVVLPPSNSNLYRSTSFVPLY